MNPTFTTSSGIAVHTVGKGEPIIFIGGGPGISSRPYRRYLEPMIPQGYQGIFWDYAGLGESIKRDVHSFKNDYADLKNIIGEMNLASFGLFAHSYGGLLALRAAEEYGPRINRLMFVSAAVGYAEILSGILERKMAVLSDAEAMEFVSILENVALGRITPEINRRYKMLELKSQLHNPKPFVVEEALEGVQFDLLVYTKNQDWLAEDFTWMLDKIKSPTWVVTAKNDIVLPPIFSEPLFNIRNSQGTEFKNSGHWAFAEEPELFARELKNFLGKTKQRLRPVDL